MQDMTNVRMIDRNRHWENIRHLSNPDLTIIVNVEYGELSFDIAEFNNGVNPRVSSTIEYIASLYHVGRLNGLDVKGGDRSFVFQADDNPQSFPSCSWERSRGCTEVKLIPDLYYFMYRGYEDFLKKPGPRWRDRKKLVFWRGSSTGIIHLTSNNIGTLPRYRLSVLAKELDEKADIGISSVVQAVDATEHSLIEQWLVATNVIKPFVDINLMNQNRYLVDIDGNCNSWSFIQRLRMGCCIFKVDSAYEQWIYPRAVPWVHYVPVREDLSDFLEKVEWAMSHEDDAEAIALSGRQLALKTTFDSEMVAAADTLFL